MPAIVRDRGESHLSFTGRSDRRDAPTAAETVGEPCFGLGGAQAPQGLCVFEPRAIAIEEENRRSIRSVGEHDRVETRPFAGDREVTRGESISKHARERGLRNDRKLCARREGSPHKWREHEGEWCFRPERVGLRRRETVKDPGAESRTAEVGPKHALFQFEGSHLAGGRADDRSDAEIAGGRHSPEPVHLSGSHPPGSALMNEMTSPSTTGSSGSRLI